MAKPTFPGEKVVSNRNGVRSYLNPKAYEPTPPQPPKEFHYPPILPKAILAGVVILGLFWLALLSPIFVIKDVQIKGQAEPETIAAIQTLKGKNIFLTGGAKTESLIATQQPGIKNIKILRGIPSTVIVELVERNAAIVWESGSQKYLVDKDGIPFKEGTSDLPLIIDQKGLPVTLGQPVSSPSFVTFIRRIDRDLPRNVALEVNTISIPETTFQIEVETTNGPRLKIDTSRDLNEQLQDIKSVLDSNQGVAIKLIDVRVKGFAYITT